jgi:hypothetical protein
LLRRRMLRNELNTHDICVPLSCPGKGQASELEIIAVTADL